MIDSLKEIVGSDYVANDKETLYAYSRDTSPESGFFAEVIVRPKSTEEVSKIIKLANDTKTPIWPRGAATSLVFMGIPLKSGGIVLDLTRMNNVIEIDEDSMSVTAETGITWGKLENELKKKGWYTGFIGPAPGLASTIGGAISVASVMYGSAKYGTAGDILLGLEVVLPTGEIIRTGSSALKKSFHHVRYGIGPDSARYPARMDPRARMSATPRDRGPGSGVLTASRSRTCARPRPRHGYDRGARPRAR